MVQVRQRLGVSERRACRVLGQARSTQRRIPKRREDEEALREDVVKVARRFGCYGYRMVTGMLRTEGWAVNHKRVERIWRQEGLKVPSKQPKRGRLWLTDGSCIRLRPLYQHHVWAYDFVADRTYDGRPLKMLTVLDEYSRECLAIVVARRLQADDVLQTLSELFAEHGPPANLRSDNGHGHERLQSTIHRRLWLHRKAMSTQAPRVAWKLFLETTPPNTPVEIPGLASRNDYSRAIIVTPEIQLHCKRDDGLRRFDPSDKQVHVDDRSNYNFISYTCRDCLATEKTFALLVRQNNLDIVAMKLGEYPPFSSPISSRIQKLLSRSDLDLYRKGCRAEAQGLGIGAATYFRRIVEEQWQRLVGEIRSAAERLGVPDLGVYDAALEETQFSTAVGILRDKIPEKLLILDGENPLTLLYKPLSKQLHGLTDEECLQQAADIRAVLTALLENIADVLKAQDELREAATRLKNPTSQSAG